jgi:hypothetical protein
MSKMKVIRMAETGCLMMMYKLQKLSIVELNERSPGDLKGNVAGGVRTGRGPFEKFVDWWQFAAVMQREE